MKNKMTSPEEMFTNQMMLILDRYYREALKEKVKRSRETHKKLSPAPISNVKNCKVI